MEEWRNCFDCYEISNVGNVRRTLISGYVKELKCSIMNRGYRYFQTNRQGKRTNHLIHQLVAKVFIGERPDNLVVDHIDRDKLNNNVSNLRYITQKENLFNSDRVYAHIPQDTENRRKLVVLEWAEKNKEIIKQKKKIYTEKNKEKVKQKRELIRYPIKCSHCNEDRDISESQRNMLRRENRLETNLCKTCNTNKLNNVL